MSRFDAAARRSGPRRRFGVTDVAIYVILTLVAVSIALPVWHVFVISISTYEAYLTDAFHMVPRTFTLEEYSRMISKSSGILRSLWVSVQVTCFGTVVSMLLTSMGGYVLSKKYLPGRTLFFWIIIPTMFFQGGLVPFYLLVRGLHLIDTQLALTLPIAIWTFYLLVMKNYFTMLPDSLEEAARMDGYNDLLIFFKLVIPLSKPVFAAISLFYAVGLWNNYFLAILFIDSAKLYPFQVILRQMIIENIQLAEMGATAGTTSVEQLKMAAIIVGILPALIVYPFVQKHFNKGIMLGAIKG